MLQKKDKNKKSGPKIKRDQTHTQPQKKASTRQARSSRQHESSHDVLCGGGRFDSDVRLSARPEERSRTLSVIAI